MRCNRRVACDEFRTRQGSEENRMLGPLIDTVIGMLLLFSLLGILNTVLVEAFPYLIKLLRNNDAGTRGALLHEAIFNLLAPTRQLGKLPQLRQAAKKAASVVTAEMEKLPGTTVARALFQHPLMASLTRSGDAAPPSYVTPRTFSTALIDVLDSHGNAVARFMADCARRGPRCVDEALESLRARGVKGGCPAPIVELYDRLFASLEAIPSDAAGAEFARLVVASSTAWPRAADLVRASAQAGRLDDLRDIVESLPDAWRSALGQVESLLRQQLKLAPGDALDEAVVKKAMPDADIPSLLAAFIDDLDRWESAEARVQRGLTATLDGLHQLIDNLPASETDLKRRLYALHDRVRLEAKDAIDGANRFYGEMEAWYDEASDRVAGWYKRRARKIGVVQDVAMCALIDADALHVLQVLSSDPVARSSAAAAAIATVQAGKGTAGLTAAQLGDCAVVQKKVDQQQQLNADEQLKLLQCPSQEMANAVKAMKESALPVGWSDDHANTVFAAWRDPKLAKDCCLARLWAELQSSAWWLWLLGIVLSALAATMGGEYWFKMLSEVVRLAGPKPGAPAASARSS